MFISSSSNEKIKQYKKLKDSKYRTQFKQFIIEGYHMVEEAKKISNLIIEIFEASENPVYYESIKTTNAIIKELANTITPQKIVAICDQNVFWDYQTKINLKTKNNFSLALDSLQDPGNIGTIIRLANAFNIKELIINNVDIFNDKILRSSQGAIFKTKITLVNNLYEFLETKKQNNYLIYTTELNKNAIELNTFKFNKKENSIIVMGNEGNGISKKISSLANKKLYIKIFFESLNVACATAIVLNHAINNESE
ncbi:TrmH family RNA methyltransferase [Mycoplasma struthionis]|uniref:RNA methyltransferase n=1 Tax=Mycoplasma struthionis TaxID=538220 RepID=A0A502M8K0_9MOLU|nr:RNA methyltransferase [Mycoplasma struthionis]TPI01540.1 RNA methyltransferase [Mycoplasma struthionis]